MQPVEEPVTGSYCCEERDLQISKLIHQWVPEFAHQRTPTSPKESWKTNANGELRLKVKSKEAWCNFDLVIDRFSTGMLGGGARILTPTGDSKNIFGSRCLWP